MNNYIIEDSWLSSVIKKKTYKIDLNSLKSRDDILQLSEELYREKNIFAFCKINSQDVVMVKSLVDIGFYPVSVSVTFTKDISDVSSYAFNKANTIYFADKKANKTIIDIAGDSFIFDRFHTDPLIEEDSADQIKRLWASNFFKGKRGFKMAVATRGDRVAGFLLLTANKLKKELVIDLIGISKNFQGQGIGKDLIYFCQNRLSNFHKFIVTTQVCNIPSIRLYEKCGFRMVSSQYVLHFHNK